MKYLRLLALVGLLMVPLAYSQAQVRIGVGIGFGPGYVGGPPACAYGYYSYYPYACAPYGFYGPSYFANGIFIGAGPWYRAGFGRPFYGRPYYGRAFSDRRSEGRASPAAKSVPRCRDNKRVRKLPEHAAEKPHAPHQQRPPRCYAPRWTGRGSPRRDVNWERSWLRKG